MARGSTASQGRAARSELSGAGNYGLPVKKGSVVEGVKIPFGVDAPNVYLSETVRNADYLEMASPAWTVRELGINRVYKTPWREYQFSTSEQMGKAIYKAEKKYEKIYKYLEPKLESLKKEVDSAIYKEKSGEGAVAPELKKRYYDVYMAYTIARNRFKQAEDLGDGLRDAVSGRTVEGVSAFYAKDWIDDGLVNEIKRSIPKEDRDRSFIPYNR